MISGGDLLAGSNKRPRARGAIRIIRDMRQLRAWSESGSAVRNERNQA